MAQKLPREDYWQKFALALKPNTLLKASTAAQRARERQRESVAVDLNLAADENENLVNAAELEGRQRRKSKKINPHQLENEESNFGTNISQSDNVCSLTVANKECQKCLQCFTEVCYGLSDLSDANAAIKSKKSIKDVESGGVDSPFTDMAKHMVKQTKDSFVIAYKLNETAFGFHVVEDFLRDPQKISILDFSAKGRIRIPTVEYTEVTLTQLGQLLNDCLTVVDVFEENYPKEKSLICLLNIFAKGVKHLEASAEHCKLVFESLLYICGQGQGMEVLQKFVNSLNSFERSDIIMEVQSLRRRIDKITIALERLSWKSHLTLHRSKGFPIRFTSAVVNKTSAKSSAKQQKVKVKKSVPTTPANTTKPKKIKVRRKKTVVDQFIKNQKNLQEESIVDPEEGDSDQ